MKSWPLDFQNRFFFPLEDPGRRYVFMLLCVAMSGDFLPLFLGGGRSSRDFTWYFVLSSSFLSHVVSKDTALAPGWMLNKIAISPKCPGLYLGLIPFALPLSWPVQ